MVIDKPSFWFTAFLFLLRVEPTHGTCYYRDGTPLEESGETSSYSWQNYQPCNSSASASMCCATGNYNNTNSFLNWCRGDGLCQEIDDGIIYRESCTDQSWEDPNCSQLCPDSTRDERITICADKSICCGQTNITCCDNGQGVFINSVGRIISSTTSTSTSSTTSSATSSDSTSIATSSVASVSPTASSTKSQGLSEGAKIGIGIGVAVPLGLTAIAALCWVFFRRGQNSMKPTTENNVYFAATQPTYELVDTKIPTAHELSGARTVPEMEGIGLPRG